MADSADLLHRFYDADFAVGERVKDELDCHFMVGHVLFVNFFVAVALGLQYRAGNTYSFDIALGDYALGFHVDELIFERRAAGIHN